MMVFFSHDRTLSTYNAKIANTTTSPTASDVDIAATPYVVCDLHDCVLLTCGHMRDGFTHRYCPASAVFGSPVAQTAYAAGPLFIGVTTIHQIEAGARRLPNLFIDRFRLRFLPSTHRTHFPSESPITASNPEVVLTRTGFPIYDGAGCRSW